MDSQGTLYAVNSERDTQRSGSNQSRTHITARGREGKALRKKLALALGLKVGSSGTPSTVDSEEEIDGNITETLRKHSKSSASQLKISETSNQITKSLEREDSSVLLRKAAKKLQTSRDILTENKERSSIVSTSGGTLGSNGQFSTTRLAKNNMTSEQQSDVTVAQGNGRSESNTEEIFSTFGEQRETTPTDQTFSSVDSVKYLRERIRKNTRARRLPKPVTSQGSDKEKIETAKQRKHSTGSILTGNASTGSQIPIRVANKRFENEKNGEAKETTSQLSKIPRLRDQNAVLGSKVALPTKNDRKMNKLLTDIFSTGTEKLQTEKLKVDLSETEGFDVGGASKQHQKQQLKFESTARKDEETESAEAQTDEMRNAQGIDVGRASKQHQKQQLKFERTAGKDEETESAEAQTNEMRNAQGIYVGGASKYVKLENSWGKYKSKLSLERKDIKNSTLNVKDGSEFEAILFELEKMKISLSKTYDDLHEMNEVTSGLRKELKEMRNI